MPDVVYSVGAVLTDFGPPYEEFTDDARLVFIVL